MLAFPILAATLGLVALASAARADFEGPYVGLQAGYASYDDDSGAEGLEYGLIAGYGISVLGPFHAGIEGEYLLSDAAGNGADLSRSAEDSYAVSALFGITLGFDTLVYGRLGYAVARLDDRAGGERSDFRVDGVATGIGVETEALLGFNLRGEIDIRFLDGASLDDVFVVPGSLELALIRRF